MSLIEIKDITKDYGKTRALDNISFTIEPNKIYGLLGRNGAGKTTLLNLLTNKLFPTSGDITIDGETVFENDKALGKVFYMMERNLYPETLRVKEVFKWTREYYPSFDIEYAGKLADSFGLPTNKRIKSLSTGYSSIFKVIVALASNAEIILLDEPVLGLDANHREQLYKEIITNYSEKPKTIIISTHLIEEVAELLEEVIIIDNGRLVKKEPAEQLLAAAYTVSGEASKVDKYIEDRKFTGEQVMGKFKSVVVLEEARHKDEALANELNLEFSMVELQKLFISLTNS
ncbi:MAG: multidrug transporter ATP-binding protein [Clostridia bacterium]|jgi:ABC-2 type transport system ATP-binding protein|nr:multidrug transporter ATP-binding protein [Clostridia bacterium]